MNPETRHIFILDDDPDALSVMIQAFNKMHHCTVCAWKPRCYVGEGLIRVHGYTNEAAMWRDPYFRHADLFIIDIKLPGRSGIQVATDLARINKDVPVLFVSGYDFPKDDTAGMPEGLLMDFISKPMELSTLRRRSMIMIKASERLRESEVKHSRLIDSIWTLFNQSDFFIVALDGEFIIQLCNIKLAKFLGYGSGDEIVGQSWSRFVPEIAEPVLRKIHGSITSGDVKFGEFTNEVISIEGDPMTVKWYNAQLNNEWNWSLSIGLPVDMDLMNKDESALRQHFHTVLASDRNSFVPLRDAIRAKVKARDGGI